MVNQWFVGLRRHARRLYAIDIDSLLDLLVQMHDDFCLIWLFLVILIIVLVEQLVRGIYVILIYMVIAIV